jgi:hypothetical protein
MASAERPTIIYALTEPQTGEVRSVGQPRHLFRRDAWHLASALFSDEGLNHEEDDR